VKEAITGHGPTAIHDKMIRYWRDVRRGLNLEVTEPAPSSEVSGSAESGTTEAA
jgi:hypothetical protein